MLVIRYYGILLAFSTVIAMPSGAVASQGSDLEEAIRKIRTADITFEGLEKIYNYREVAPNAEARASVIKACAAGLLYLGRNDIYSKGLRAQVPDVNTFEKSLLVSCEDCKGTGEIVNRCKTCRGGSKCKNRSCVSGRVRHEGFDGRFEYRRCTVCQGTGSCKDCNGRGNVAQPCRRCVGRGGVFSASTALAICRLELENSIKTFESIRQEDAERVASEEYKVKLRETEIAAKREAVIAEGRAAGEERARQDAIAARDAAERERREIENEKYAAQDKDYLKSIVVIDGDRGVGTGFLTEFKGKKVVFSNAHVLLGNRSLRLRTTGGVDLKYNRILVSKDRDIVAYEIDVSDGLSWLRIHENMADINNQEAVVVFGNSDGGGVVTTLRGKMQGIGPEKVEVDATFVQGNSGSPIIAYPYNGVIGMATYLTRDPQVDWAKRSTRFADVRRFGVRIDNVEWKDFVPLDGEGYEKALDVFDEIVAFADNEVMKARWQGAYYRATGEIKAKAETLLERYEATPGWMRQHAEKAALAAYVCVLILK